MEITKEKLLSIISEEAGEIDEMGKYWDKENPISRPLKFDDGTIYGHDMRQNPYDEQSPRVNVIFSCDIEKFIADHPDLVKKLEEQYGNIKWTTDVCPKYNPHKKTTRVYQDLPTKQTNVDIITRPYEATGEKYDVQQSIKRKFNPIIRKAFGSESAEGKEFETVLSKRSIPPIMPGNPKYEDSHGDSWTNEKIVYRVHSYNTYESAGDFLKAVVSRIKGDIPTPNTLYLARQFNKKYRNWEETKINDKTYEGKTEIFKLDVRGYKELNLDVSMKMIFEIIGEKVGDNSFNWSIRMKNKFGRKRPDEYRLNTGLKAIQLKEGGYLDEGTLVVNKTVQLDPEKKFDENYVVMDDIAVAQGLYEAIADFKSMIESINPKSALKYATFKRSDVEKVNEGLNKIVRNVIKDLNR